MPHAIPQTWNGSVSDLWSNASNWTPNTVPNSSSASVTVTNATNNPVLIDIAPTIANLTLGASNSVSLNNAESLTIAGGAGAGSFDIAGTLTVNSTGSFTDMILAGTSGSTITLSGGGSLTLSNSFNNRVFSTTGDTLVNNAGNTIQGAGQLGINNAGFAFALNNAGIINANQSNALQVAPSNTVTNTGTLEATAGGTLDLIATVTNTSGLIQATGASSVVELSGSTITGGTLTTSGGGTVQNSGTATLDGVTISTGSTFTAVNSSSTTLQGTITINPTATLAQSSTGSFTDLHISGTVELAGGGTLAMSNSPNNRIFATGSDTLINDAGNTISGAGQLGINNAGFAFTLNNAGIINANQSNPLQVAPSNTVTNTGTIEATAGGTLALIATVINTGGLIQATGASSVVDLSGSTITSGTLTTQSGGTIENIGTATLNGVTISDASTVTAVNSSSTTLMGIITIKPTGTLAQSSTGSFTDLHISGTVELAGGGTLAMSNSPNNRVFATGSDTLINDAGDTIQGSGQLGINNAGFAFDLNNKGTIDANVSGGTLQVAPTNTVTNTNLMEASNGGTLALLGTFNNTGGTIQATGAGSVAELSGSMITGGTLTTTSGGTVQNSGTATLDGVTISGGSTFTAVNSSSTTLMGIITINPTATLVQSSTGSFTDLHISGTVELAGGGTLAMSNSPNNRVFATGTDTLINDVGNTISGAGQLGINNAGFGFTLNNKGTINANQSGSILQVAPTNTVINTNLMEATNGGTLSLIGAFTNTGGTIQATGAGSFVDFSGGTITGGTLTTTSGGAIGNIGTATLDSVTISAGSTVTGVNSSSTTLMGTITIDPTGTLALSSTGSFTDLHISGTVELAGGGTLAMSNSPNNRIFATGTDTLINDAGNTIQGSGQLGINNSGFAFLLNNKGTIDANQSAPLQVAPTDAAGGVINTGTLEATVGGTLLLTGGTFNNTGGLILATDSGSVVDFNGATIVGGTLTTTSGGVIENSGTATLDGTTNSPTISTGSTVTLVNSTSTTLMGTIINNGTIAQSSTGSFTDLHISGNVTLDGTGALALSDSPNNRIFATGSDSLTNGANHTIQGSGQLGIDNAGFGFTLTNNGTILANQSNALNIAPTGNTTNNGTFQANSGSTLFMNGTLTNYDPGTSTLTGGTYNVFSGTIELSQANIGTGAVIASNAATILLDGASAKIADGSGNDILQGFLATNAATGSFTVQNGSNFTSAPSFSNAGAVNIGGGTTFAAPSAYTQSGGTTQVDGTLSAPGGATINAGVLKGTGTVAGAVTVGTGSGPGAFLSPGNSPGTLTIQSTLTLNSDATYKFELNSSTATADEVIANGVTINGAKFSFTDLGSGSLVPGTVFTAIDDTAVSLIAGTFSNLPDHSTFTDNGNTFKVNYEGGDGNDLTLTSIGTTSVPDQGSTLLLMAGALAALLGMQRFWACAK